MDLVSIKRASLRIAAFFMTLLVCQTASAAPAIRITVIPPYNTAGGSQSSVYIEGTVSGLKNPDDYWVVIYSLTDQWWVQPELANPFTGIRDKGLWSTNIHAGSRYAALLIRKDSGFKPPSPVGVRPSAGNPAIVAETEVEGKKDVGKSP